MKLVNYQIQNHILKLFDKIKNKEELKDKIEKLLYQLHKNQVKNWNIFYLDGIVFESRMYIGYNKYLQNTGQFRNIENNSISLETRQFHAIKIDELIPKFTRGEHQLYQIRMKARKEKQNKQSQADDKEEKEVDIANPDVVTNPITAIYFYQRFNSKKRCI